MNKRLVWSVAVSIGFFLVVGAGSTIVGQDAMRDKSECPPELLKVLAETEKEVREKGGFAIVGRAKFDDGTPIKRGDLDFSLHDDPDNAVHNCYGWSDGWFYTRNIHPGPISKRIFDEAKDRGEYRGQRLRAYALHYNPSSPVEFPVVWGTVHYTTITLHKTPEDEKGPISGTVKDEDGKPLAGASVRLTIAATTNWAGMPNLTTKTDPEGKFAFEPLTAQRYRLGVSKAGFTSAGADAEPGTESAVREFTLHPKKNVRFDYVYQPDGSRDFTTGELRTKTFTMDAEKGGGFRFKDGKQANDGIPQDFKLQREGKEFVFRNFFIGKDNGIYDAGEVPFESVKEAPAEDDAYRPPNENGVNHPVPIPVKEKHVYVVRMYDGNYGKLIVREFVPAE